MTNGYRQVRIIFLAHHLIPHFYWKTMKKSSRTQMRPGGVILTLQWRHGMTCGQRAVDVWLLVVFISFPWAGMSTNVCVMAKTTEILIWCAIIKRINLYR